MRLRALLLLLPLSACDYALWNWSVTGNHDVIALASGMTLLPLVALTLGLLCWAALGFAARLPRRYSVSMRAPARQQGARTKRPASAAISDASPASAAQAASAAHPTSAAQAVNESHTADRQPATTSEQPPTAPIRRIAA